MNKRLNLQASTMLLFIVVGSILSIAGVIRGQEVRTDDFGRTLVEVPVLYLPEEAKEASVGGQVTAFVSVNKDGIVTSVESITGPDWVCPAVNTPAVSALRRVAREAAMKVRLSPDPDDDAALSTTNLYFYFDAQPSTEKLLDVSTTLGVRTGVRTIDHQSAGVSQCAAQFAKAAVSSCGKSCSSKRCG